MTVFVAAELIGSDESKSSQPKNRPLLLVSGATTTVNRYVGHPHLGRLTQPRCGNDVRDLADSGFWFGVDNASLAGLDADAYLALLDQVRANDQRRLLFVAVPDDAQMTPAGPAVTWIGTLALWRSWHRAIEKRGLPAAIVLQNDATSATVPWDDIAAVFVGGDTAWKLSDEAAELIIEAKDRGKWVHVGRVNSEIRELHFRDIGIDSFDGGQYSKWPDTHIPACLERLSRPHTAHRREYRQQSFAA